MKQFYSLILLVLLLPAVSCVSKKSADQLLSSKDSLAMVVAQKDSVINDIFASMNDVAENLNAIKSRENIINTNINNGEIKKQSAAQINEDIEAINQLLIENRKTIERLRSTASLLKKADVKIAGLEKLIAQLNLQVQQKDQEIALLQRNLHNLNNQVVELTSEVSGLNTKVSGLTEERTSLQGEVKQTTDLLNKGYYIVGAEKELLKKEIVYKSGFIGRTLKINENRSLDSFTQIDIREFDQVVIGEKKASLISSHPAGSYEFVMNDSGVFESLIIVDKSKFWEYSKVMVISFK